MYCGHCGNAVDVSAVACVKCGAPPTTGRAFCQNCGVANANPQAVICLSCGAAIGQRPAGARAAALVYPSNPPKEPIVAAVLSGVLPGVGQMMLGQTAKGIVLLLAAFGIGTATMFIAAPAIWIISAIDAYLTGQKLKNGRPVGEWEFF